MIISITYGMTKLYEGLDIDNNTAPKVKIARNYMNTIELLIKSSDLNTVKAFLQGMPEKRPLTILVIDKEGNDLLGRNVIRQSLPEDNDNTAHRSQHASSNGFVRVVEAKDGSVYRLRVIDGVIGKRLMPFESRLLAGGLRPSLGGPFTLRHN